MGPFEITALPPEEVGQLPKYSDPGRVLFRCYKDEWQRFSRKDWLYFEVYDFDVDGSTFWIVEGTGIEWWLEEWFDIEMADAECWFVVEGITGAAGTSYHHEYGPEGWEEFYPGDVRYATEAEIASQQLTIR